MRAGKERLPVWPSINFSDRNEMYLLLVVAALLILIGIVTGVSLHELSKERKLRSRYFKEAKRQRD
jgi:hypothetical protein